MRRIQYRQKTQIGARSLMQMVVFVLVLTIPPAHAISHSRAFLSYVAHKMTFTQYNAGKLHIYYISQKHLDAWSTFILNKSNGFTRPGVERINESIRTYCWTILGSQSQVKSMCRQRILCAEAISCQHCRSNLKSRRFAQPDYPISKRTQIRAQQG